jgi:hypothetical protein
LGKAQLAINLPAITMTAQYVLQVFDATQSDATAPVASKTLNIAVSANIPSQQTAIAQFVTPAQASDLAQLNARQIDDTVVPQLMAEIFAAFKLAYPDVDFYLDWSNATANAQSFVYIDGRQKVVIFGGLVRVACLYYEAFCFIVAQSVARFSGQLPVDANKLSYVGVADYYATAVVLGHVFYAISDNSDLISGVAAQLKTLFQTGISAANQAADPNNPAANPGIPCRYSAISSGIFGGALPGCVSGAAGQTPAPPAQVATR